MKPAPDLRFLLLAVLCLAGPIRAVADEQPVSMWRVEGKHNHLYLLGSVHLLREQDHPLPKVIDAAYDDAEALVMELDMDDLDPLALQAETNRMGLLQGERTLRDLLGSDAWNEASEAADEMQIPLDLLMKTEPWYAAITVEQLALLRIGFNPRYGVEMTMADRAGRDGKPITGLESAEEQLALLDGLPEDAQRDLLLQTFAESRDLKDQMGQLIDAWRRGDTGFLEQNMLADMRRNADLYEAIVAGRNRAWVDKIVALLDDEDDYLVIVGTLHLIGPDGVPELLRQHGIETRQMHESL